MTPALRLFAGTLTPWSLPQGYSGPGSCCLSLPGGNRLHWGLRREGPPGLIPGGSATGTHTCHDQQREKRREQRPPPNPDPHVATPCRALEESPFSSAPQAAWCPACSPAAQSQRQPALRFAHDQAPAALTTRAHPRLELLAVVHLHLQTPASAYPRGSGRRSKAQARVK